MQCLLKLSGVAQYAIWGKACYVSLFCCLPVLKKKYCGVLQSGFLDSFPFDPAKLDSPTNQVKELKNGRLAMVRPLLLPAWLPPFI